MANAARPLPFPVLPTYEGEDSPDVAAFIAAHPELTALLSEARPVVIRYFGTDAHVVLDVVEDPEAPLPEATRRLFARVLVLTDADEAVARLDRFDDGWWIEARRRSRVPLTFTAGPA